METGETLSRLRLSLSEVRHWLRVLAAADPDRLGCHLQAADRHLDAVETEATAAARRAPFPQGIGSHGGPGLTGTR